MTGLPMTRATRTALTTRERPHPPAAARPVTIRWALPCRRIRPTARRAVGRRAPARAGREQAKPTAGAAGTDGGAKPTGFVTLRRASGPTKVWHHRATHCGNVAQPGAED